MYRCVFSFGWVLADIHLFCFPQTVFSEFVRWCRQPFFLFIRNVYILYIFCYLRYFGTQISIRCARACDPDASGSSEAAIFLVVHSPADWRTAGVSASLWPHFAPIIHSKSMLKFSATWVTSKHKITKIISVETVYQSHWQPSFANCWQPQVVFVNTW